MKNIAWNDIIQTKQYDYLIGKFIGKKVPAVGFSIGFERIFAILSENNDRVDYGKKRIALFYNTDEYTEAVIKADELRKEYDVSMFEKPKKLGKFLNKIEAKGYYGFVVYGESDEIKAMGE